MKYDIFQAIADPTRRQLINLVTHRTLTPNALSEQFDVSRQAISKHLQILSDCGLITVKQRGRERHYEARLNVLSEVTDWVSAQRQVWATRFDKMELLLEEQTKKSSQKKRTTIKHRRN